MAEALALCRASMRSALSYRLRTVLSVLSLLASVVPIYFIAEALQSTMEGVIQGQGDRYFSFLVVGMVVFSFLVTAVQGLPNALSSAIRTGTLEALFTTPARVPSILAGLCGYGFGWTFLRAIVLLLAASVLGTQLAWGQIGPALLVLTLTVVAHIPFGMMAAASVLVFRTAGPLPAAALAVSGLLGGVYYPTSVVPSWLHDLTAALPLTYGLRALRRTLLEGAGLGAVSGDLFMLLAFCVGLGAIGVITLSAALRYARRTGNLGQY